MHVITQQQTGDYVEVVTAYLNLLKPSGNFTYHQV
jgi:hypothetical protein